MPLGIKLVCTARLTTTNRPVPSRQSPMPVWKTGSQPCALRQDRAEPMQLQVYWAVGWILSRCWSFPGRCVTIPLRDMRNALPAACRYARWEIRSLTLHGRSPACANMPRCWRIRRISVICWKNPFIWPRTVGPDRAGSTSPSITRV